MGSRIRRLGGAGVGVEGWKYSLTERDAGVLGACRTHSLEAGRMLGERDGSVCSLDRSGSIYSLGIHALLRGADATFNTGDRLCSRGKYSSACPGTQQISTFSLPPVAASVPGYGDNGASKP